MDNIRTHIARHLLSIGAVFLRPDEPFVWASGIKPHLLRQPPDPHRSGGPE